MTGEFPLIFCQLYNHGLATSEHNAKLPEFYSRFWNPSCRGVDAFAEFWGDQFGEFVPHISVVYRIVKKLITDKACAVLFSFFQSN